MGDELDNTFMRCPFNETHLIRPSRWQYHLEKCRKSSGALVKTAICPFDRRHEVLEEELRYHMNICPSRGPIEIFIAQDCARKAGVVANHGNCDLPPPPALELLPSETWEGDEDGDLGMPEMKALYLPESRSAELRTAVSQTVESHEPPAQPVRRPLQQSKAQSFEPTSRPGLDIFNILGGAGIGRGRQTSLDELVMGTRQAAAKAPAAATTPGSSGVNTAQTPLMGASDVGRQHRGRGRLMQPQGHASPNPQSPQSSQASASPLLKGSPVPAISPHRFVNSASSPAPPRSYSDILKGREAGCGETVMFIPQNNGEEHSLSSHVEAFPEQVLCGGALRHEVIKPCSAAGQVKTPESSAWSVSQQVHRSPTRTPPLGRGRSPWSGDEKTIPRNLEKECKDCSQERRQTIKDIAMLARCKELDVPFYRPEAQYCLTAPESRQSPDGSPPRTQNSLLPAGTDSTSPLCNGTASWDSLQSTPSAMNALLPTPSYPFPAMGLGRGQPVDSLVNISESLLGIQPSSGHGGLGQGRGQGLQGAQALGNRSLASSGVGMVGGRGASQSVGGLGNRSLARGGVGVVGGRGASQAVGGLGRGLWGISTGLPFGHLGSVNQAVSGYNSPTGGDAHGDHSSKV